MRASPLSSAAYAPLPAHHALALKLIARTGLDRASPIRDHSTDGFAQALREAGYRCMIAHGRCRLWHDPARCLDGVNAAYAAEVRAAVAPEGWAVIACRAGDSDVLERALSRRFRKREVHRFRRCLNAGQIEPIDYLVLERVA